jgi:hypothetical protein
MLALCNMLYLFMLLLARIPHMCSFAGKLQESLFVLANRCMGLGASETTQVSPSTHVVVTTVTLVQLFVAVTVRLFLVPVASLGYLAVCSPWILRAFPDLTAPRHSKNLSCFQNSYS